MKTATKKNVDVKKARASRLRRAMRLQIFRATALFAAANPKPLLITPSRATLARRIFQSRHIVGVLTGSEKGAQRTWIERERRASVGC